MAAVIGENPFSCAITLAASRNLALGNAEIGQRGNRPAPISKTRLVLLPLIVIPGA